MLVFEFRVYFFAYLILYSVHLSKVQSNGILSRVLLIDVTYAQRGEICIALLAIGNLVFPFDDSVSPERST